MKACIWFIFGMVSVLNSLSAQTVNRFIIIDQFGYLPLSKKIAVIKDPQTGFDADMAFSPGNNYVVINAKTGEHVFRGQPVSWKTGSIDGTSGDKIWHFDFSEVTQMGNYYILDSVKNVRSYEFVISYFVYDEVLRQAVRTFFYQRAGFAKESQFAGQGWADAASHIGPLQDRNARLFSDRNNSETERDLSGGWYDAGDYNKYTNWTASYVVEMMKAYKENPNAWSDYYNIPESGNGIPDLLDEAKWGIDHLLRMQENHGGVLSIVSLSHASPPSSATGQSVYGPASTSATLNTAAAFALSSTVYRSINDDYADTLVKRAEKAWAWAVSNPSVIFNNNQEQNGSSGVGAGNQEVDDYGRAMAKLKAACYLYEATNKTEYRNYFDANFSVAHMIEWNYVYPYEPSNQEILLYYTKISGATSSVATQIKNTYLNAINTNSENFPAWYNKKDPYMAHLDSYTWGSNNQKGAQGSAFYNVIEYNLNASKNQDAYDASLGYIHYIHGVNPLNLVYLSNMYQFGGDSCVNEFYHSWFTNGSPLWDRVGTSVYGPPPGFVPGGPNPSYDWDGCCPGGCGSTTNNAICNSESISPPKNQPKQKSYKDFNTSWPLNSWSVTENSCGYQVSYIRLLSKFVDIYTDCNGDSAGTAVFDICGTCTGGNTGITAETEICDCPGQKKSNTIVLAGCDSIVSPGGKFTWKLSGLYTDSLKTGTGCDSVVFYNVTIGNTIYHSVKDTSCSTYTLPRGELVHVSGIYTDTLTAKNGCDSIVTIDLFIPEINVIVNYIEETLIAALDEGPYVWVDCDNNFEVVPGAGEQAFTPQVSGNYALVVKKYGCADTSECIGVQRTGVEFNQFGDGLRVFPNPAQSHINVQMPDTYEFVNVQLRNTSGMLIFRDKYFHDRRFTIPVNVVPGLYFLALTNEEGQQAVVKIEIR